MQGGFLQERLNKRHVGKRERLFNPEEWPIDRDRDANWDYVWTILGAFGIFVGIVTAGMFAWILGII